MIGMKMKELRKMRKISQEKVAQDLKLGTSTIASYELDRREPDITTLTSIADYYSVTIDELVGREPANQNYTHDELDLIRKYRHLSGKEKSAVIALVNALE